jgi:hypothetical protein
MNYIKTLKHCIIPFLCVLPMFGALACSQDVAVETTTQSMDQIGTAISDLPENARIAAPYLQEDLETLWYSITGNIEVAAQTIGVEEPSHPLAEAQEAREKLISGESFMEVARQAMTQLTKDDLEEMPTSDLGALNGVLPFEIDLESCGENLAEVLNSLDVGQVSAVLKSKVGYHLVQLIDREGGRLRIGHVVFEIDPPDDASQPDESDESEEVATETDPLADAISRLARAIADR